MTLNMSNISRTLPTAPSSAPTTPARPDYVDPTIFRNPYVGDTRHERTMSHPMPVFFKDSTPMQKEENAQPGLIAKVCEWVGKLFG